MLTRSHSIVCSFMLYWRRVCVCFNKRVFRILYEQEEIKEPLAIKWKCASSLNAAYFSHIHCFLVATAIGTRRRWR